MNTIEEEGRRREVVLAKEVLHVAIHLKLHKDCEFNLIIKKEDNNYKKRMK